MEQLEFGMNNNAADTESLIKQLEDTGDYKVIRRLKPTERYHADNDADKKIAIYLDTETTGFDSTTEEIIELAMIPFEYDEQGRIYRVLPAYNELQDPGFPIPAVISQVTHITDDMVKGRAIDWSAVAKMLTTANLVIAHNAAFDRPFAEKYLNDFERIPWACSIQDVNWNDEGFEGVKLEYLAYKYGFFYEGHRATIDCQAGIELLSRTLPLSNDPVLKRLLDNTQRVDVRLWAEGSPFDKKDMLKARGYRWSPGDVKNPKAWYIDIQQEELEAEKEFLKNEIYGGRMRNLPQLTITAQERYSNRT
jgi:DNA polymerase-3 subunit epsilon